MDVPAFYRLALLAGACVLLGLVFGVAAFIEHRRNRPPRGKHRLRR